jgi:hypothetical protein
MGKYLGMSRKGKQEYFFKSNEKFKNQNNLEGWEKRERVTIAGVWNYSESKFSFLFVFFL